MNDIFSAIWQAASALLGVLVFAIIMWWLVRAHSHLWRMVSAHYPKRSATRPIVNKSPDTIVITRRGTSGPILTGNVEYRQYTGATIAVHGGSLSISLLPPFNIMCPQIELPLEEMELQRTDWALWPEPYALRMRGLAGLDIILGRETIQWLRRNANGSPFKAGT